MILFHKVFITNIAYKDMQFSDIFQILVLKVVVFSENIVNFVAQASNLRQNGTAIL